MGSLGFSHRRTKRRLGYFCCLHGCPHRLLCLQVLHSVPGCLSSTRHHQAISRISLRWTPLARSTALARRQRHRSEAMVAPLASSTNIPSPDSSLLSDTNVPFYATMGASKSKILEPIRERTMSACQDAISPLSFHLSSKKDPVFVAFSSSISTNTDSANTCITMSLCDQVFTYNLAMPAA